MERWLPARDAATPRLGRSPARGGRSERSAGARHWCGSCATAPTRRPRSSSGTCPAPPPGVLYALRLRDPNGLVREVRIARGTAATRIPVEGEAAVGLPAAGPNLVDRRPLPPGARLPLRPHRHRSRRPASPASTAPRPPGSCADRDRRGAARPRAPRPACCGPKPSGPPPPSRALTVICAVGECLDVIRARAALAFAEKDGPTVDLVYHVAEGPEAGGAGDPARAGGGDLRHPAPPPRRDAGLRPADRLVAAVRRVRGAAGAPARRRRAARGTGLARALAAAEPHDTRCWRRQSPGTTAVASRTPALTASASPASRSWRL